MNSHCDTIFFFSNRHRYKDFHNCDIYIPSGTSAIIECDNADKIAWQYHIAARVHNI